MQFVVVYNLTRFARDKYDHFALRAHLKSLGISLRSATEPIDDTSTGKLMEGVLAAFAQFDNDVRSDRTRAGMKAALELGRWTFLAPLGYLNAPAVDGQEPDPRSGARAARATGVPGVRNGTIHEAGSARKHGEAWPDARDAVSRSPRRAFGTMLRNRSTSAASTCPEYGVSSKRGDFEPLIDGRMFYRVQAVLDGRCRSDRSEPAERIRTSRCAATSVARRAEDR